MVTQIVEAQAMSRAFDFADISRAFGISALLSWLLQLAAGRAIYRARYAPPSSAPACR